MKVLYNNNNYDVVLLDSPVTVNDVPCWYTVILREHNVTEVNIQSYPAAIEAADYLNKKLEGFQFNMGKKESNNVIALNS